MSVAIVDLQKSLATPMAMRSSAPSLIVQSSW
jgi:hypothetical protein